LFGTGRIGTARSGFSPDYGTVMRSRIAVNTTRESGYFAYRRQSGSCLR
jgi:hypothetical protein